MNTELIKNNNIISKSYIPDNNYTSDNYRDEEFNLYIHIVELDNTSIYVEPVLENPENIDYNNNIILHILSSKGSKGLGNIIRMLSKGGFKYRCNLKRKLDKVFYLQSIVREFLFENLGE